MHWSVKSFPKAFENFNFLGPHILGFFLPRNAPKLKSESHHPISLMTKIEPFVP